jgi:hypothetical protein
LLSYHGISKSFTQLSLTVPPSSPINEAENEKFRRKKENDPEEVRASENSPVKNLTSKLN